MTLEDFLSLCLAVLNLHVTTVEKSDDASPVYTLREPTRQLELSFAAANYQRYRVGPYTVHDRSDLPYERLQSLHSQVLEAAERRYEEQRIDAFDNANLILKRLTAHVPPAIT